MLLRSKTVVHLARFSIFPGADPHPGPVGGSGNPIPSAERPRQH
jgi:hypothetical protein